MLERFLKRDLELFRGSLKEEGREPAGIEERRKPVLARPLRVCQCPENPVRGT